VSSVITKCYEMVYKQAIGNPDDLEKIRGLEVQVVDLTEKLETIKAKRLEDRNKLKDAEKIKIMHDQVSVVLNLSLSLFYLLSIVF